QLRARVLQVGVVGVVYVTGETRDFDVHVNYGGWVRRTSNDHVEVVVRLLSHMPDPRGNRYVSLFLPDTERGDGEVRFLRSFRVARKVAVHRSHRSVRRQ